MTEENSPHARYRRTLEDFRALLKPHAPTGDQITLATMGKVFTLGPGTSRDLLRALDVALTIDTVACDPQRNTTIRELIDRVKERQEWLAKAVRVAAEALRTLNPECAAPVYRFSADELLLLRWALDVAVPLYLATGEAPATLSKRQRICDNMRAAFRGSDGVGLVMLSNTVAVLHNAFLHYSHADAMVPEAPPPPDALRNAANAMVASVAITQGQLVPVDAALRPALDERTHGWRNPPAAYQDEEGGAK